MGTGSPLVNEKETGVFLAKGCKVPPNSVMRVGSQLSESMAGEYIVKAATNGEILIPRTLHNGGDNPVLCLINLSDHYVEVGKGEVLAYAEEVCSNVEPIGIQEVEVAEQGGLENGKREIPEHLINLFDKSKGELNEQEQTQLSKLLCEFEDVFPKSEFDLGKFNTIQHGIDTETAVLEQSSGLIFTCQYAELASSLEYHTFPAKVSRHSSTRGNGNTSLMVRAFKAL
jgi:hypothetical protein